MSLTRQSSFEEKENIKSFEEEIAYFFGVNDEQPIIEAYMEALQRLHELQSFSTSVLREAILPYLKQAYQLISTQKGWEFDISLAAEIELQIIIGHRDCASFEFIQNLMIQLYNLVFQSDSILIKKSAMLRTFLYQYKADALKTGGVSVQDRMIMLEIAKTSKELLNSIER